VDIRVASVTQARWMCEMLFAGLMEHSGLYYASPAVSRTMTLGGAPGGCAGVGLDHINFGRTLRVDDLAGDLHYPMPRCIPFERDLSDGMELGATLGYLVDEAAGRVNKAGGCGRVGSPGGFDRQCSLAAAMFTTLEREKPIPIDVASIEFNVGDMAGG